MINYTALYRSNGVRRITQLTTPPLSVLETFSFPKQSIYHYRPDGNADVGPSQTDYLLRLIKNPINVEHIREIAENNGNPRHLQLNLEGTIRKWHAKNRRYRYVRNLDASLKDANTLLIVNYGFIPQAYRYAKMMYSNMYKWRNEESAIWKNINSLANISERQQFVTFKLPKILPSVSTLKLGEVSNIQKTIKLFNTDESRLILEFWKWFGPNRKTSMINLIEEKNYDRVNILFIESGKWYVANLGVLNSWRKATEEELIENPERNKIGIDSVLYQKRFMAMLIALFQAKTVVADTGVVKDEVSDGSASTSIKVTTQTSAPPTLNENGELVSAPPDSGTVEINPEDNVELTNDTAKDYEHDAEFEAQIDDDLKVLERISENHHGVLDDDGVETKPIITDSLEVTPESGITKLCDRLADQGVLSAAEYRRYTGLASKYKEILSPNKTETLAEFVKVDPEVLKVPDVPNIADNIGIIDKSMLKSSLNDVDRTYITKVFEKDVAGMVLGIQNAGIAITDYEVEEISDISGASKLYSVRISPVEGMSSTLRFRLPVVNEDGVYESNGIKYKMRKQRGD